MFMRGLLVLSLGLLLVAGQALATGETRLMRYPDIHGDKIVFTYGGDLWIVSSAGGAAHRLTTHIGMEIFPKFSPDGGQIAFSGSYDGNFDVYTMPATGGAPTRLTYHPWGDAVLEWHPSGAKILFRSAKASEGNPGPRYNKLFTIDVDGGYPEQLPLWEGELSSYSPDGTMLAYNRKPREFRTWKRYQGGMAQDIWLYDPANNRAEQLTTFAGTDNFPMFYSEDKIYFVSDRKNPTSDIAATLNIYCINPHTKEIRKITNHNEYDVKWPSIGGDAIVYENAGYLYVLDLKTETTKKLTVTVPSDLLLARPHYQKVGGMIGGMDLSKTGKRALFEARGDIFTVPAKKGEPRNLTRTPGIRERNPAWSPDGRWISYVSDRGGEYNIYLRKSDGSGEEVKLTSRTSGWPWYLTWSPDSEKLVFSDETMSLFYVDVESKKTHKIDENDKFYFLSWDWSPDSKWIAYIKPGDNYFGSIHLYTLEEKKSYQVTSDFYDDDEPVFDPDGKYLYFTSNRTWNPMFSNFETNFNYLYTSNVCVATLQKDTPSPFEPESDEEEIAEEEEEEGEEEEGGEEKEKEEKGDEDAEDEEEEEGTKIDIEGLGDRVVSLPIGIGNYVGLSAGEGKLFYVTYQSRPAAYGPPDLSHIAIMQYDFKEREAKKIISGINGYALSADRKKILYRARNVFGIIDAAPGKNVGDDKIATEKLEAKVDPVDEWAQMFEEAYRLERDFFYDPNMHGIDWKKMKQKYGELVPYISHRDDLNYIIGELIAELSAGHTYVGGGDFPDYERVGGGLLGCDFEIDTASGRYRFEKIYQGKNWDKSYRAPLTQPGIAVEEGDYLIAIGGIELTYPMNVQGLLENTAGRQVILKVSANPSGEGAREYTVEPIGGESWVRYADWVEGNRKKVDEATDGRVGYIHVPNTSIWGLNEFASAFYAQSRKDGIIVDERYNSGGFIPDMFVERLARRVTALWARRHGQSWATPGSATHGHLVMIINGYAGSGGDAFPYFFRQKGLGPLIGKRTWGGLIGISHGIRLMDGGRVTMPSFGLFNLEGKWDVEGVGVYPDIDIDNRPDEVVAGRDPQLEKAIEVIMQKIEEDPPGLPKKPKYPIKKKR